MHEELIRRLNETKTMSIVGMRTFCLLELRRIQHLLQCRNFIVKLGHGRQETERFQQRHTNT